MSKTKIYISFLIVLTFNACSMVQKNSTKAEIQPLPPHLKRAEMQFQKGEKKFSEGDIQTAKYHFDRTINILLDSDSKNPLIKNQFKNYIDKISEIELYYLHCIEPDNLEEHRTFLQEVISSPLFVPSEREISEVKQKLDQKNPTHTIPLIVNSNVVSFLHAFQTVRNQSIQRALNRSVEYIDTFKKIFKSYELPEELIYVPIIESGFRYNALSRARARGMWQFMASTARMFDLRVDWIVDERLDPFKSAIAAAKYFKCLYEEYGDWFLALACYNGGTRRVNRAISQLKTRDFFEIARTRYLRRETRNYVPAFLASVILAQSPTEYGFFLPESSSRWAHTKIVSIPSPSDLQTVATITGIALKTIKDLNPDLIREFTPFNRKFHALRVPLNLDENLLKNIRRLPPEKEYFVGWYRVKKGDSLYKIARKFGTSVKKIKKTNKLHSNLIKPGKQLLIPR